MEVTKYTAKQIALAKARAEFEDFRQRESSPAITVSASKVPAVADREERVFHCAARAGMRSRLVLKLTANTAEVVAVRSATLGDHIGEASAGPTQSALTTRELSLGVYRQCPHCPSTGVVLCSRCGTLSCVGPDEANHRCPNCRRTAPLSFSGIALAFANPSAKTYTTAQTAIAAQPLPRQSGQKLLTLNSVKRLTYKGK